MTPVRYDLKRGHVIFPTRRMAVTTGAAWLLLELAAARGGVVGYDELIWRRWGGSGEPERAKDVLAQFIREARLLLVGGDLSIGTEYGRGFTLRRLVGPVGFEPTAPRLKVECSAD